MINITQLLEGGNGKVEILMDGNRLLHTDAIIAKEQVGNDDECSLQKAEVESLSESQNRSIRLLDVLFPML